MLPVLRRSRRHDEVISPVGIPAIPTAITAMDGAIAPLSMAFWLGIGRERYLCFFK